MLKLEKSVVCIIDTQSTDIIRTANSFKSNFELCCIGIVKIGFGPTISENSDNRMKSFSNVEDGQGCDGYPSSTSCDIKSLAVVIVILIIPQLENEIKDNSVKQIKIKHLINYKSKSIVMI